MEPPAYLFSAQACENTAETSFQAVVWILLHAVKCERPRGLCTEDVIPSCNTVGCLLACTPAATYVSTWLMSPAVEEQKTRREKKQHTVLGASGRPALSQTVAVNVVFSALPVSNGLLSLRFIHPFFLLSFATTSFPLASSGSAPPRPLQTVRLSLSLSPPLLPRRRLGRLFPILEDSRRDGGQGADGVPPGGADAGMDRGSKSEQLHQVGSPSPPPSSGLRRPSMAPCACVFSSLQHVLMWHVAFTAYICLH